MSTPTDDYGRPLSGITGEQRRGQVTTRAVETAAGWVGQVLVDGSIVTEGQPYEVTQDAVNGVNEFVTERVRAFFTVPLLTSEVEAPYVETEGGQAVADSNGRIADSGASTVTQQVHK